VIGCIPYKTVIPINCTAQANAVTGPWGTETVWDQTTYNSQLGFVADAWVYTGRNVAVAPVCSGGGAAPGPSASPTGPDPSGPHNSAILTVAEQYPNGAWGGQCLTWVRTVVDAAGRTIPGFGLDLSQYQARWARVANPVTAWSQVEPGDIVQFIGGPYGAHTLIITSGNSPSTAMVIDSNFAAPNSVGRGTFASRYAAEAPANELKPTTYEIWRVSA
jgi:hypothetical protein